MGQRLRTELHQWEASQGDKGVLLRGAPLIEAENWLNRRQSNLTEAERSFIQASLDLQEAESLIQREPPIFTSGARRRFLDEFFGRMKVG